MFRALVPLANKCLVRGWLPDWLIRMGIRGLLKEKLAQERTDGVEFGQARMMKFINGLKAGPIAVDTSKANEQHYEVPTEFFQYCLGKHMKYSSGYWRPGVVQIDQSEHDMLEITIERADLADGQDILELGCGWGSLTLFMAAKFPAGRITAVSNSKSQKEYIDAQARERKLDNIQVITADMNHFNTEKKFDRVVSVEMFEHMRNYKRLLEKISAFLKDDGKLFVHIFTHREFAYFYEEEDESDWIGKYFFTGGIMPSDHMLFYFQDHLRIIDHWRVSGAHYQKTSEAWLTNMDAHKKDIIPILEQTYGRQQAGKWWNYWRVFYMSCAELWGYRQGGEWLVSHYLFVKNKKGA